MWDTIACKVQGRGHKKSGTPCQDQVYALQEGGVSVIALADGAGSAKLSHYGALAVVKYICTLLIQEFEMLYHNDDGVAVKQYLMNKIHDCLVSEAKLLECQLKDLASTLLFVAVKGDQMICGHIGDGVIGYKQGDALKILSAPENGEFINSTYFTTSSDALITMKLIKGNISSLSGFVLMSDGTETSLYHKKHKTLAPVLSKIMNLNSYIPVSTIQSSLQQSFEQVISSTTTDDCSMILMVRHNNIFNSYFSLNHYQKAQFLHLNPHCSKKVISKYDVILTYLSEERSLTDLSHHLHLKPVHTKKSLQKLLDLNLIEQQNNHYKVIIKK